VRIDHAVSQRLASLFICGAVRTTDKNLTDCVNTKILYFIFSTGRIRVFSMVVGKTTTVLLNGVKRFAFIQTSTCFPRRAGILNMIQIVLTLNFILFLGAFAKLRKVIIKFVMSVCPSAWNNSSPNARVLIKLDI
jgi:hypothetical protein